MAPHSRPPRKVIVGTGILGPTDFADNYAARVDAAKRYVEQVTAETERRYPGRPCDLIVMTEHMIMQGPRDGSAADRAVDLEGEVLDTFAPLARAANSNLVLTLIRAVDRPGNIYTNCAAVIDRNGRLVGTYDKLHPVVQVDRTVPESGMTPGTTDVPVFDLDFGRIGVQICFDVTYEDGWRTLAEKGADLVAWPTASPATVKPRRWAEQFGYYIVATPYRDIAAIYEPTGLYAAKIHPPDRILVHEIDLSWMILHWSAKLLEGKAFTNTFGNRAGYHYERTEDTGLFWSNDPDMTIGEMAKQVGVEESGAFLSRNTEVVNAARP